MKPELSRIFILSSILGIGVLHSTAGGANPITPLAPTSSAQEVLEEDTNLANIPHTLENHGVALQLADTGSPVAQQVTPVEPPLPEPISPQERRNLEQQWLLPLPPTIEIPVPQKRRRVTPGVAPGSSLLTPTGFGSRRGQTFAGASFQGRTRFTDSSDGGISAGFGLGDPQKSVGLQTTVTVLDLFNNRSYDDGFANRGAISFKVHRQLPEDFAVAAGIENAIVWGFTDAGTSAYGVVSKVFRLKQTTSEPFSRITVSLGLGNGRFRSEEDFQNDVSAVNVFGSVAVRVARPVSAIAEWTGQDLALGVSVVPFRNVPLVVTPSFEDITGNAGDGARFRLSVGYSYSFGF